MANGKPGAPKGSKNNPNGRPKLGLSMAEFVRKNPDTKKVINKVIAVAKTLNTKKEHQHAQSCAKIIMDKSIPSLKAQEIDVQGGLEIKMPSITIKKAN